MMFLIGSQAAIHRGVELKRKINKHEYDLVATPMDVLNLMDWLGFNGYRATISRHLKYDGKYTIKAVGVSTGAIITFDIDATMNGQYHALKSGSANHSVHEMFGSQIYVPTIVELYMIKRSHANFPVHFEKTVHDLAAMQEGFHDHYTPFLLRAAPFYMVCHEIAKERYGSNQSRISLNKSNEEFFAPANHLRLYVHDDLHKAVSYFKEPLYLRCKPDPTKAALSEKLFYEMTHEYRLNMVREEAMVIALERFLIPKYAPNAGTPIITDDDEADHRDAFRKALIKLTRDMCKGWFQDFILDNWQVLYSAQSLAPYIRWFNNELQRGNISLIEKEIA